VVLSTIFNFFKEIFDEFHQNGYFACHFGAFDGLRDPLPEPIWRVCW
jgi:hypothetical protein